MEIWKAIENFPGYEVSSEGRVRSIDRVASDGRRVSGKVLSPGPSGKGYLKVCLSVAGKVTSKNIHTLVAEAFLPSPLDKKVINHKNGVKTDNRVENLEYVTYSDNNQHAYDTGLKARGSGHYNAKLTEDQVREIKRAGKGQKTYEQIGSLYGVSKATIRDILTGKTWKNILP